MKTPAEMAAVGKEYSDQTALFAWAAMARLFGVRIAGLNASYTKPGWAKQLYEESGGIGLAVPQLRWLHAIHNQGHGDAIRGSRAKAEGVRAGVSDIFLPVVQSFHSKPPLDSNWIKTGFGETSKFYLAGLYIELKKTSGGVTSQAQTDFQTDMRAEGYACEVCVGWEAARDCLMRYLSLTP